ncbi:MAG TPA: histidine--tRNA ligase [Gemmatimonadales bacterium]|nr:histidine--tRNA ligase [Gemmatimonadales bacterium]
MQKGALPGFRDFYPEELARRAHIFAVWRQVATRYGFEEYDGPPLETLELYTAKSGDEIVAQLYNFTDKGDRAVALRPEMTPTLARMVAARANGLKKPIRWFSLPQLFRYERQQRGRLREHFQLNCDLIGEAGPLADAEIIALAIDVMRGFGLTEKDVRVRLSDRRVIQILFRQYGIGPELDEQVFRILDRFEKLKREELVKQLESILNPTQIDQVVAIPAIVGPEGLQRALGSTLTKSVAVGPLFKVVESLNEMGLGEFVDLDFTVVRGLAYYTGTVFELFDTGRTLRAICGGGRYDDLTNAVGGVPLPAVGFGMGDVVLGELLKEKGKLPAYAGSIDVFVAAEEQGMAAALQLTHQLRDAGIRAEFALGGQTLSKQQDIAKARNARVLVTLGTAEAQVRDLVARTQVPVAMTQVVEKVRAMLGAGH